MCVGRKSAWAETGSVGAETGSVGCKPEVWGRKLEVWGRKPEVWGGNRKCGAETGSDVKQLTKLLPNTTQKLFVRLVPLFSYILLKRQRNHQCITLYIGYAREKAFAWKLLGEILFMCVFV